MLTLPKADPQLPGLTFVARLHTGGPGGLRSFSPQSPDSTRAGKGSDPSAMGSRQVASSGVDTYLSSQHRIWPKLWVQNPAPSLTLA